MSTLRDFFEENPELAELTQTELEKVLEAADIKADLEVEAWQEGRSYENQSKGL